MMWVWSYFKLDMCCETWNSLQIRVNMDADFDMRELGGVRMGPNKKKHPPSWLCKRSWTPWWSMMNWRSWRTWNWWRRRKIDDVSLWQMLIRWIVECGQPCKKLDLQLWLGRRGTVKVSMVGAPSVTGRSWLRCQSEAGRLRLLSWAR